MYPDILTFNVCFVIAVSERRRGGYMGYSSADKQRVQKDYNRDHRSRSYVSTHYQYNVHIIPER